jgi:hypothetical protein
MTIDEKIYVLGQDFKDYVLSIYKVAWHVLCDTTLQEAINDYTTIKG